MMLSWKTIRLIRNIGLAVLFCGWITNYSTGFVLGVAIVLSSYQMLVLKMEQILTVLIPDTSESKTDLK